MLNREILLGSGVEERRVLVPWTSHETAGCRLPFLNGKQSKQVTQTN